MNVAIVGAAGYTGGMLIRMLLHHQHVGESNITAVSGSHAGQHVASAHPDLAGSTDLIFAPNVMGTPDVIFLCTGHGKAASWMSEHDVAADTLVIDLSADHRLDPAWVYGLPEVHRDRIAASRRIANPGCFATTIELGLLPLAEQKLINGTVVVNATTGSTGAGQAPSETTHYSWRANNQSVYKAFTHQHLAEISAVLGFEPTFIPMRGAFPRGIIAASVLRTEHKASELLALYRTRYSAHPFVTITDDLPDVKRAVGTNQCFIGMEQHGQDLVIVSVLDNLIKGASGQAIQNMNIAFGLPQTSGLELVAVGY